MGCGDKKAGGAIYCIRMIGVYGPGVLLLEKMLPARVSSVHQKRLVYSIKPI